MLDNRNGTPLQKTKPISELVTLVDEYMHDVEATSFVELLNESLEAFENYRTEVQKKSGVDFEKAFIYYEIATSFIVSKIPNLKDINTYKQATNSRDLQAWQLYNDLTSNLFNDPYIATVKEILKATVPSKTTPRPSSEVRISALPNIFDSFTTGFIDSSSLKKFIDEFSDAVLLIDVRSREEYNKSHIMAKNIICIEPVSIRSKFSDHDVENYSLLTSPESEKVLFHKRSQFEIIVLYDYDSNSITQSEQTLKLWKILNEKSFDQPLQRKSIILSGGLEDWLSKFGLSGFQNNHGNLSHPIPTLARRSSLSHQSASPIARNINEYLSNPSKSDLRNGAQLTKNYSQLPTPVQSLHRKNSFKLPSLSKYSSSPSNSTPMPKTVTPSLPSSRNQFNSTTPSSTSSLSDLKKSNSSIQELYCTTGLCNLGNSCYMNCILQCLLGTIPLIQVFIDGSYKKHVNINSKLGTKGIMAKFFAELSQSLYQKSGTVYEPKNFKIAVGSINSTFRNNNQQDCAEFLNFVLDGLHEDLNESGAKARLKALTEQEENLRESMPIRIASTIEWERYLKTDFSAIVSLFQGQYSSQLKCLECGTTSTTYQSFSVLSLPIPDNLTNEPLSKIPLEKCLDEFTKLEVLDEDDRWHCSKCKQLRKSTKKITITRLPSNLIIHLKRFKTEFGLRKITNFVEYPFAMDLTSYWPSVTTKQEEIELLNFPSRGQTPPFKFSLYGVANHYGTLQSGHYTAYVWKGKVKKWCYFDDTKVVVNTDKNSVINSNAYVLFYTRSY